jgi:hypothetical protein
MNKIYVIKAIYLAHLIRYTTVYNIPIVKKLVYFSSYKNFLAVYIKFFASFPQILNKLDCALHV